MSAFRSSGDLSADRRYLWGDASAKAGDHPAAADLFMQAVDLAPHWAPAWLALGLARMQCADVEGARLALARCLTLEPEDELGASVHLARLDGQAVAMPAAYVAGLFDDYAERFDDHLTGALAYRGPQVLMAALEAHTGARSYERVLDLGCGTGLMAQALAHRAAIIDGIDLSQRMLDVASRRGLYRHLRMDDVVAGTTTLAAEGDYDLIIGADVLVYLGDLAPLCATVARALMARGLFAFTLQAEGGESYHLGQDMRFAHSRPYVDTVCHAAGLRVIHCAAVSTRKDGGRDVPGWVVLAEGC